LDVALLANKLYQRVRARRQIAAAESPLYLGNLSLIAPQICDVETVDAQDEVLESPKICSPANDQTSVTLLRLNGCACRKAACNHNRD